MQCPTCHGDLTASAADMDDVQPDVCHHTFDCEACNKTYVIEFQPVEITEVERDDTE